MNQHLPGATQFKVIRAITAVVLTAFTGLFIYYVVESTPQFIHRYQLRAADKTAIGTVESIDSTYVKYSGTGRGNSERSYDSAVVSYKVADVMGEEKTYTAKLPIHTPKKGEITVVYYNSSNPSDATNEVEVLITKEFWKTVTILGSIMVVLAIGSISLFFKRPRFPLRKNKK